MADVVKALVHHVDIATVGVRVPVAATKKGHWEDPCTECAPIVQRRYKKTLEDLETIIHLPETTFVRIPPHSHSDL